MSVVEGWFERDPEDGSDRRTSDLTVFARTVDRSGRRTSDLTVFALTVDRSDRVERRIWSDLIVGFDRSDQLVEACIRGTSPILDVVETFVDMASYLPLQVTEGGCRGIGERAVGMVAEFPGRVSHPSFYLFSPLFIPPFPLFPSCSGLI